MEQRKAGPRDDDAGRHLLFGLVLIVIGTAFLVDRLAWLDLDSRFWPFVLILIGAMKFLAPPGAGSRRPGAWLLFIGCWGLVNEFHLMGLDYGSSWPLMIIGGGLMIVWRGWEGPAVCGSTHARTGREPQS